MLWSIILLLIKHVQQDNRGKRLRYGATLVHIEIIKYSRLDVITYWELRGYFRDTWSEPDESKIFL